MFFSFLIIIFTYLSINLSIFMQSLNIRVCAEKFPVWSRRQWPWSTIEEYFFIVTLMGLYSRKPFAGSFGKHFTWGEQEEIMRFRNILFHKKIQETEIVKNNLNPAWFNPISWSLTQIYIHAFQDLSSSSANLEYYFKNRHWRKLFSTSSYAYPSLDYRRFKFIPFSFLFRFSRLSSWIHTIPLTRNRRN